MDCFGCSTRLVLSEIVVIVVAFGVGTWFIVQPARRFWKTWRWTTLSLSAFILFAAFAARPVDLVDKRMASPVADRTLVQVELAKVNDEIQFRIDQEDTWFHFKFLLVGAMIAGFFSIFQFSPKPRAPLTRIVRSDTTCTFLALACVVALAIDIHLRNNMVVIQQLALWIKYYAEPALMPSPANGFIPWEDFLRRAGGMHADQAYGFTFYPQLHFLTWVLYFLYVSCFHEIAAEPGKQKEPNERGLLAGGFVLVHVALGACAFVGHFVPGSLELDVIPWGRKCLQSGADAARPYWLLALLLAAINSPFLFRFLFPSRFRVTS